MSSELRTKWQRRVFGGLFLGYLVLAGARSGVSVASADMMAPVTAGGFGLSKKQLGTILSAFTLAYGPSKFLGGVVSDLVSCRLLFAGAVLLAGLANLCFSAASSFNLFVVAWAAHGAVQGLGWPALSSILIKWFPKERLGQIWGLCTTAGNIGQSAAPLVLSWLAVQYGWHTVFLVPGLAASAVSVLVLVLVYDKPTDVGFATPPEEKQATHGKLSLAQALWRHVMPDTMFWLLCIADALVYLVMKGLANWTIAFLLEARSFSKLQAASAATCFEVGGIVGTNAACTLSDMLQGRRNLASMLFTALSVPTLAVLWAVPDEAQPEGASPLAFGHGLAALFLLGLAMNGPKALCGIAAREMAHPQAAGTAGGILGLAGQAHGKGPNPNPRLQYCIVIVS